MLFRDPIPDADYRYRWVDRLPKKPKGLEKTRGRGRMMMRLLIVIAALVASLSTIAGETPTQFMERYVGYFNAENLEQYQTAFEFPVIRSTGGVLEILSDPTEPPLAQIELPHQCDDVVDWSINNGILDITLKLTPQGSALETESEDIDDDIEDDLAPVSSDVSVDLADDDDDEDDDGGIPIF